MHENGGVTLTRIALMAGTFLVAGFIVVVLVGAHRGATPVVALVALVVLIGVGNLLYGKNSHGAMAKARDRPAQEAQNRAIDRAHLARRQARLEARREARRQSVPDRHRDRFGRRRPTGADEDTGADAGEGAAEGAGR
jgi:hypothetical protein